MEQPLSPPSAPATVLYSDEEAQAILTHALGLGEQDISHESLVKMAGDLGISPDALARAEAELRTRRSAADDHAAFRAEEQLPIRYHALATVLGAAFFFLFFGALAVVSGSVEVLLPAVIITLCGALAFGLHMAYYLMGRSGPEYERRFEAWRSKQQRRLEREQRRRLQG